jgi:hypothetical protein
MTLTSGKAESIYAFYTYVEKVGEFDGRTSYLVGVHDRLFLRKETVKTTGTFNRRRDKLLH